jgi:hypothetical protein
MENEASSIIVGQYSRRNIERGKVDRDCRLLEHMERIIQDHGLHLAGSALARHQQPAIVRGYGKIDQSPFNYRHDLENAHILLLNRTDR